MPNSNSPKSRGKVKPFSISRLLSKGIKNTKNLRVFIKSPEGFFLVFAALFGGLFIFITPPIQAPDESAHFYKAYQLSNLQLFPDEFMEDGEERYGSRLPSSVIDATEAFKGDVSGDPSKEFNTSLYSGYIDQPLKPSNIEYVHYEGSAIYAPVAYIPQAIGVTLGKIFEASPLFLIWLGRLFNLAAWILIIYYAIKRLPTFKWGMVFAVLNPVILFLAASLSADALVVALVCMFVSYIMRAIQSSELLTSKQIAVLFFIIFLLALTKPTNAIFGLLLLLIPVSKFGGVKKYILFTFAGILIGILTALTWNYLLREAVVAVGQLQRPGSGVDPGLQLSYIFADPLRYIKNLILNYVLVADGFYGDSVLRTYFGVFGWLDTNIPLWTILLYLIGFVVAVMYQCGRGLVLTVAQKIGILVFFVVSFIGTVTALYLNYTPVGNSVIDGVQGRYFMPYVIPLICVVSSKRKILNLDQSKLAIILGTLLAVVLTVSIIKVFLRYYS